jgi:hypothetical protein
MTLAGALLCAKNEDWNIPSDIQADFIYLIQGKQFSTTSSYVHDFNIFPSEMQQFY